MTWGYTHAKMRFAFNGECDQLFVDESLLPFRSRPEAKKMLRSARPGDTLIFLHLGVLVHNRGTLWTRRRRLFLLLRWFHQRGLIVRYCYRDFEILPQPAVKRRKTDLISALGSMADDGAWYVWYRHRGKVEVIGAFTCEDSARTCARRYPFSRVAKGRPWRESPAPP